MRSGVRAGGARLPAAGPGSPWGRGASAAPRLPRRAAGLGAAGRGKLSSLAARPLGFAASLLAGAGRDPPPAPARVTACTGTRNAPARPPPPPPSRARSAAPREREFPATSKARSEPVVVAVQELVEDASDVFRVGVRPVALAAQRLRHAARRGESRRQPRASALPPGSPRRGVGPGRERPRAGRAAGRPSPAAAGCVGA